MPTAETRVLAGPVVRRLLRESRNADTNRLIDRMLKIADPVFGADVRAWQASGSPRSGDSKHLEGTVLLRLRPDALDIHRPAADRGGIPVTDCVELPDGRTLVAVGELGVWLLSREGRAVTHFAEPAHAIVISDHGDRAILLARRGETFRVSRLDLLTRRVQHWCDARFTQFAADFDGSVWFVASGGTLCAIDATAARWQHLWKVDERDAIVSAIARDAGWLSATIGGQKWSEVWTFELPSIVLRRRTPIEWEKDETPIAGQGYAMASVTPKGMLVLTGQRVGPSGKPGCAAVMGYIHGRRKSLPVLGRASLRMPP